ncbi:carboxypeptidase, partial [Lactobacillaceae bacterium KNUT 0156]|nr:carboxypeptidase [Weissella cibaria]
KARRDEVLEAVAQNNVITQAQAKKYMALPVTDGLMTTHPSSSTQDEEAKVDDAYIMSTLAEIKKLGYDVNKDGLTVQTNLNQKVQDRAYAIGNTADYVNWKDDDMQVGMTVTDPNNGKVIAQLGGRNLTALQGTNRATNTVRSSGSTAKPIVDYGPAVENLGWSTNHLVLDTPYTYPGTNIQPNDWDHKFMGSMTMRNALAQS